MVGAEKINLASTLNLVVVDVVVVDIVVDVAIKIEVVDTIIEAASNTIAEVVVKLADVAWVLIYYPMRS